MADKLTRKGVVLVGLQTVAGTPETLTGDNAILCTVPEVTYSGNRRTRDYMRDSLSPAGFGVGIKKTTISFETELKGHNDNLNPDDATRLDALFQSCALESRIVLALPVSTKTGLTLGATLSGATGTGTIYFVHPTQNVVFLHTATATFVASESLTQSGGGYTGTAGANPNDDLRREYVPISEPDDMAICTIEYYADGILHQLSDCRGDAEVTLDPDGYPTVKFAMTGFYVQPVDDTAPASTYEDHQPPVCTNINMRVGTYTPTGVGAFTLTGGNAISDKTDMNSVSGLGGVMITGREAKLSFEIDQDTVTNFNPYDIWEDGTKQAITTTIGSAAGNRVTVIVPELQLEEPKTAEKDGRAVYTLSGICTKADLDYLIQTH